MDGWSAARAAAVTLTGPCPRLPDFAFGTWFTWWHAYSEAEAKDDIAHWESLKLPLDVWALDMNWRSIANHTDRYYDHPNTTLFPNFTEWFTFLKSKRLRTYFNDHPFPVASRNAGGLQTSPEETAFRWQGLSEWMSRGLTFWWFDHNWGFSIPPPFVNTSITSGVWDGLDNAAWGSHIYYESVSAYDRLRKAAGDMWYGGRPITLTKFGLPDPRASTAATAWAESPAQHRFPVWWTGDGVDLATSVHTMVDAGVHDLKPYVHSDCGGDYRGSAGDLLRWTAHCAFGTILRFHGDNHRPWSYDDHTTGVIRNYLHTRYSLLPTILAGGAEASASGFPIAARCDLFWPTLPSSRARDQYIWLNDTLVAPISDSAHNLTSRNVWIPPGEWHDAWNGTVVRGPRSMSVTQPYERIPLWHRAGGLLVLAHDGAMRTDEQDWSTLTVEAFPHSNPLEPHIVDEPRTTRRTLVERASGDGGREGRTVLTMRTTHPPALPGPASKPVASTAVSIQIGAGGVSRAWLLRIHLRRGQRPAACTIDGAPAKFRLVAPTMVEAASEAFWPFGGRGSAPAPLAGVIVEIDVSGDAHRSRAVEVQVM